MSMSVEVEQSRAIPVTPEQAFGGIIETNVPVVFRRRYGPIPPIRRVSGRDGGNWAGTVGQTRVLELGGGGSITETVVSVDEPRSWTYVITDIVGPLALLLARIDGQFVFTPAGTGTPSSRGATQCILGPVWPSPHYPPSAGCGAVTRDRC